MDNLYYFYLVKVQYLSVDEKGIYKKMTQQFVAKAVSFTDAESIIVNELSQYDYDEMTIKAMTILNIEDVIDDGPFEHPEENKWFKCSTEFTTTTENGAEKKTRVNHLVLASSVREAEQQVIKYMKNSLLDFSTVTVQETKIVDIFNNN